MCAPSPGSSPTFGPAPNLGTLPRPQARLCLQVPRFLQKHCALDLHDTKLLLAVSGGADSMALLTMFTALRPRMGHSLCVVHVDHALRPESPEEAAFVARLCADWGIPCTVRPIPVKKFAAQHNTGLEEASRILRYQMLEEERQRNNADWIITGHHRQDLAEDIVLRLIRGTGWPALGGMQAVDPERHLLRPLLLCEPEDLRALLNSLPLPWQEDASNADISYCRNRMRHILLPLLRVENPSLHQGMENLWLLAREDEAHWDQVISAALSHYQVSLSPPRICLPKALLQAHDRATRLRLYMKAIHSLEQGQARATTLFQLDEAWSQGRGNTYFQLPGKISAHIIRGDVVVSVKAEQDKGPDLTDIVL